jgi:hypothetical protein
MWEACRDALRSAAPDAAALAVVGRCCDAWDADPSTKFADYGIDHQPDLVWWGQDIEYVDPTLLHHCMAPHRVLCPPSRSGPRELFLGPKKWLLLSNVVVYIRK